MFVIKAVTVCLMVAAPEPVCKTYENDGRREFATEEACHAQGTEDSRALAMRLALFNGIFSWGGWYAGVECVPAGFDT